MQPLQDKNISIVRISVKRLKAASLTKKFKFYAFVFFIIMFTLIIKYAKKTSIFHLNLVKNETKIGKYSIVEFYLFTHSSFQAKKLLAVRILQNRKKVQIFNVYYIKSSNPQHIARMQIFLSPAGVGFCNFRLSKNICRTTYFIRPNIEYCAVKLQVTSQVILRQLESNFLSIMFSTAPP